VDIMQWGRSNMKLSVQIGLVLIFFLSNMQTLRAQGTHQDTKGDCSPAISQVSGNVTIVCRGDIDEYFQGVQQLSQLINSKEADTNAVRNYIHSHLSLIDGNYIPPRIGDSSHYWRARQTFFNPPFDQGSPAKPDFAIVDYAGPFSNVSHKITLVLLGPVNDPVYLEDGSPSKFNSAATAFLQFLNSNVTGDFIARVQGTTDYRLPPLDSKRFVTVDTLIIAGRRSAIPKQYLNKMREGNSGQYHQLGGSLITYDTFLESLASRRL
jgi:hypothetical protein